MEGQLWLSIVLGLSLFVTSLHAKQVGDINFVCPPGWVFLDTSCYLMVSKEVEWMEAEKICKRYFSMPLEVDDEVENEELAKMAESSSWDSFWVGHKIEDKCKGYWDNYQPPSSVSQESCAAIQKNGRWKVVPCQSRLPFFCKKPACIEGTFDCGNGKCLNNKWLCDNIDDCGNNLDETDCDTSCSFRETGATGSINYFSTYAANSDCTWSIITPPGTQIAVTFSTIRLENNVDFLEVWVGGQVLSDARLDERLTGSHDNKKVYSINNMMVLRLLSDATINSFGFRLSWTSSDAQLSTDVRQLTAGTGWLSLMSPFYPNTPPSGFRREWIVTSSDESIVTLEIEKVDLSPDWALMIYNGEEYDDPILMASKASDLASPAIYYSTDSKIRIIMMAKDTSGGGEGIKMRAKTGCSVEIQAASGVIESPGYSKSNYPARVMCSWILRAPTNANRDMKLKILDLNLETGGSDLLQVFNGVDASAPALHPEDSNNGYTGDMTGSIPITLKGGNALYVKFTSSLIQNNGKFKFEFSIDCPYIPESPNMIKSSNDTAYESAVTVNCETGYSFRQQELYLKPSVVFSCQKGGMWDKSRNPTCQIIYCGAPKAIEFGFIKNSTNAVTYNNKATYQCYEGFQMQSQPDVTCLSTGQWSTSPTCTSSVCGLPPNVFNAEKKIITETDDTSYGAIVEYTCNDGYEIHGTSRRRCLTTSQWSDTAPTCVKKKCPLPMIANGNLNVNDPVDYGDTISLNCLDGYWATTTNTTSALLQCKADQTFADVECVDENECTHFSSPCQPTSSQDCINTIGSYICKCKDGYRKDDSGQCVEIDECAEMTSGCDHDCTNTPAGSYTCSCKAGYSLYENGTSGIIIVSGETGLRMNDVYHVKHSCVRKICPRPAELENGKIHSMRNSFQFEDELMYSCNLGFSLSITSPRVCQANGAWSGPDPVCTAITCPAQTRMGTVVQQNMVKGIYPATPVGFGERVIIECNREESTPFNKTRFCAYDRTTKTYTLQGDAPECPVVDCGPVADIAGLNKPSLSSTVYGTSFTFTCQSGAIRKGMSTSNNNDVKCLVNGRWGYGNLTCTATKCPDPGTRGGTRQTFESYEQGKIVSYECIRPGFTITSQANITCVYSSSGTASWNGSPPTCIDSTSPQFQNCDGVQDVSIDKMQAPGFSVPIAQDNAGFVSTVTVSPTGFNPSDPVYQDTMATYTATDGNGNMKQCQYDITVKDRSPGTLICQQNIEYKATSTPTMYNVTEKLSYSGGQLTSFPQVTANLDSVGQETDYRVTLRTDLGTDKTCAFKVKIVAGGCYKQLVPSLLNGKIYTEETGNGLRVHVNCSLGYAMSGGLTEKTYICSGENNWSPALPLDDCIQYTPTDYAYSVSLTLTTATALLGNCRDNFGVLYSNALSSTSSLINQHCSRGIQTNTNYKFSATDAQIIDPPTFNTHKVTVTLKVDNNDGQADALNACRDKLNANKTTLFAYNGDGCDFEVDASQSIGIASSQAGESCPSGYTLTSVGSNKQCFPCPPGKLRKSDGSCEDCPDGQYQQVAGQTACISCGSDMSSVTPRTSSASCIKKCTGGFYSATGNPPCQQCPVNRYWGNYTTCTPCPDLGSTLHVTGATSVSQCKAACPTGQYSLTGYVPCTPCPRHFYQDQRAQTQCKECPMTYVTDNTGSQALSDCKVGSVTTEVCSVACSDPGTQVCSYIYHRLTCTCKPGYTGDRCESEINYCLSNPCFNGGQCKRKLGGYDCECPKAQECEMVETTTKYQPSINTLQIQTTTEASCKQQCINNAGCEAAAFNPTDGFCSLYNAEQDGQKTIDSASVYKYFTKNCQDTFFYTGTNCEEDKVDNCENHNCHENSVCRDLVNTFECVCPSGGQYINLRCDPKSNLCSPNPCRNNGLCSRSDGVRYQCICLPGYTGVDCEIPINECDMNPSGCLYGGQCVDAVNSYSCSCASGFSGPAGHCETHRNFCTSGVCSNGLCINNYVNLTADCVCEHPFERDSNGRCSRINFCASSPCRNSTYTQRCDSLIDGYRCVCRSGYEGSLCQHNINDCVDNPCEHGTCVDGVGSFSCECDPGWTGGTCNVDVIDCLGQCPFASSERCVDLNQDYQCICRPGYTGKNCTDEINECDSVPCQHGGACTDGQADYACDCPPGWEGKSCENMVDNCVRGGINCQNDGVCYSVFTDAFCSCKTGTQGLLCEDSPNVCSLLPPCTTQGSCQQIGGDATCNCNDLYGGVSCELIKDHCTAGDCKNGGVCTLTDPSGYTCDCPAGYSGSKCENEESVCAVGKCPSSTLCYSEGRTAYCLCPPTQVLTGSTCKDASANFDLFMDMSYESEAVKSSTPFYLAGDMTVMFWIGYFNSGRSVIISNMEGTENYFELYPRKVKLSINDESEDVEMSTATLETVADQWDHVAVSWASNGDYKIYVNGIQVSTGSLDFNLTVSGTSLKMVSFDPMFKGYISRLTVWRKILSPIDIAAAVQNVNFNPSGDLALGWTLYKLTGRSRRYAPSRAGLSVKLCGTNRPQVDTCSGLPNKMKPTVSSCPSADVTYSTDDRTVEAVTVFNTPSAAGGATIFATLKDALLMKGRYDVVYASKDADGNYGICRFKVYIRGSSLCSLSGLAVSTACGSDAISGFCSSGQAPSVPTPNILRCGKRGSYNLMKPRELFVPPVCGAVSPQRFSVKLTLTYAVTVTCTEFTIQSIIPEVKGKFLNIISNRWVGLCTGACTNMEVVARCDVSKVIVTVTLINLAEKLTKSDNSVSLRPDEILKITAKESSDLELTGIGTLQKDIVIVILSPSCNQAVGIGNCVACGPGSFFNSTMGVCMYCPIGSYTDAFSQTSCKSCGDKTTLREGSKSLSDCVEKCTPGHKYFGGRCQPCPRDHYQELEGKSFCYPCPLNKRTKVAGTDKESLCFDDCASGTELQDDGSCKDCPQGFYRTQSIHDNCQACSDGNTTVGTRTVSSTGCVLPPCQKGQYINEDRICLPCPRGKYQPVKWQRQCLMCEDSYTTENEGEFNETKCKFYCPKGKEESPLDSKKCEDCPAGKYRDDSLEQRFLPCQDCTPGFTTASSGASNITTDCTIRICNPGTYRNVTDNKCYSCPVGQFQPDALQTECRECKPRYTTEGERSTNETTDCKFYCEDGEQILSAENETCTICPRGTWRSNTDMLRFLSCQPCAGSDLTTDTTGSKLASDCKLKVCTAGQQLTINLLGCEDCPVDYYQEDPLPSSTTKCTKCGTGKGTKQIKTTKSSDCLPFCAEGQQVSDSGVCEPCPQGTWNDGSPQMRFLKCQPCSNSDYTTASEGAKSEDECTLRNCDEGYKIVSATSCEPCGYGKFQPNKAQSSCIDCSTIGPDLNTSTPMATSEDQCTVSCPPGKQGQEGSCSPCPPDTFKSTQGYDICMPCTGSFTSNDNKDACTVTYCDKGVGYTDALTCVDCVPGYYKETRGNTACIACSKNFTTSGSKTTTADGCDQLNCEPGFFAHNTDICTLCPVGFYKSTVGTANCTECPEGKTTETEGATTDTDCTLVVCPVGQYRTSGNACEKCPLGQYQPNTGAKKCEECDSGYTTLTTGKALATDCLIVCSSGKYRSARDSCSDCLVGQYQPNAGSDRCINCTSGFTTQNKASTSETDCYRTCPAGQFRPSSDRTACNQCPRGQYQPDAGQTDCDSCDPNFSTLQQSSTSANQCMPLCSSGKYLNVTSRTCIECPLGTFQSLSGTLVQECTKCPGGTTTANTGSTVSANCNLADCNPGYYRKAGEGCTACGQGYYQPEKAQTSCMKCNDGYTTRLDVTTAVSDSSCIRDCDNGYEYNLVTKQCTTCLLGMIRDKTVLDHCYNCPEGKSTTTRGALTCIDAPESPTSLLVRRRVKIRMSFRVAVCDNPGIVEHTISISIRFLIRRQSSRYPRLCIGNCINIKISFTQTCGIGRRRKRSNIPVTAEITASDLPDQIANTADTLTRSGESLLTEALANNDDVATNLTQADITYEAITAPEVTTECVSGSRKVGGVCEACPIGTMHNTTSDQCESCPKDQYQDQTGQTTCKPCAGKLKTLETKSNSSAACLSKCKLESNYCKNKGTCVDVDPNTVRCNCPESYTGETCAIRQSVESDLQYIIIGVCAGIFVILVVILVIGCCCCRKDPSDKTSKDMHSIVAPSAGYPDYMQSPFMTRDYLAPQGYVQYPNPEFNDAYDFYKSGRRYSDH